MNRRSGAWRRTAAAVHGVAVAPLPALLPVAVGLGLAAVATAGAVMRPNGIGAHAATAIAYAIVREVIPLGLAAWLALRAGTAVSAEIGLLLARRGGRARLLGQGRRLLEALMLSRAVGLCAGAMGLAVILSAAALCGGFAAAAALGLAPPGLRLRAIVSAIGAAGVIVALVKAAGFGALCALAGCFHGLRAGRGAGAIAGVPRAAARGGLSALVLCLSLDGAISLAPLW